MGKRPSGRTRGNYLSAINPDNLATLAAPKPKKKRLQPKTGLPPSPGASGILVLASKDGEPSIFRHVRTRDQAIKLQTTLALDGWLCTVPAFVRPPKSKKPVFGRK